MEALPPSLLMETMVPSLWRLWSPPYGDYGPLLRGVTYKVKRGEVAYGVNKGPWVDMSSWIDMAPWIMTGSTLPHRV